MRGSETCSTRTLTRAPLEELLLAEVLALRAIVLNVQHDLAAQRPVTVDRTLQHIAEADRTKYRGILEAEQQKRREPTTYQRRAL